MVAHVLARLAPQVGDVLVNANQNAERYGALGYPVVPDAVGGFAGPLAGLHAGMTAARRAFVVTVPCDSPFVPIDLVARLAAGLEAKGAQLAVAKTFDQPHPVFALVRRDVLPNLARFSKAADARSTPGMPRSRRWKCNFDDEADAFRNINTADELAAAAKG